MGNQPGKLQAHTHSGRPKKNVHWKSAERPSPPGRPILTPLSEQQPDVVNLRWERPLLDGGSPITGYIVEHRRLGSPHWVRATPTPISSCEVSISGLEPGWRYQFRAFSENIVGRSEASELSDQLTVTLQRNAITVPRFTDELLDTDAVEDERIEFRVRILGEPPPEINWFKDGYEIFSSRRTKIVNENDVSVLIIHQVALTDEGEIKCTATNRAGHVVTKARLMVQAPPKIRLPRTYEDGLIVEAEEVLRLKVGVAGQPPPVVSWLHEGEPVPSGGRFEVTNTEKNSLLKIDNVQREDRGEYMVRAFNKLGEDVTAFLVTVTARPQPPGRVRLNMSFGKSATLSWTAPVDDGGCKIGNYIVEYFRIGWNVWLKAATTRSLSTTLNDLIEGSEYKFRVKAENPYGLSEPSEESEVLFIPDPKRGITKPKSATKIAGDEKPAKPTPPRRKTLSPPRPHADASTGTGASPRQSPSAVRKPKPQLIDNEELHREMSYGTSEQALKMDVRKSPSMSSADSAMQSSSKTKLNLTVITKTAMAEEAAAELPAKANPPARTPAASPLVFFKSKLATKDKAFASALTQPPSLPPPPLAPSLATPERSITPEVHSQAAVEDKLSPTKKSAPPPLRKSPTPPEPIKSTPALQRSAEPVQLGDNQNVRRYSGQALSPAKNVPALAIAIATASAMAVGGGGEAAKLTNLPNLPTPTIEISAPPVAEAAAAVIEEELPEAKPSSRRFSRPAAEKHDEVHTSNEFMLVVFDKNSKVKDKDKQDSFELDLEDAIQAPPISISAPDLAFLEFGNVHTTFPLRRSVSSTELLYERAMARFYEAVELEQAEKQRKQKDKQEKLAPAAFRKRLGSISEAERLSFERRSELRRQSADVVQDLKQQLGRKWGSREDISGMKQLSRTTDMLSASQELADYDRRHHDEDERSESTAEDSADMDMDMDDEDYEEQHQQRPQQQASSYDLGSDYTESTASSDQDSIEKFKMELLARTHSPSPRDLETYHPRNMAAGTFTPYRAPTPEQAAVVLTRPMPLPSPDFVPKPILKRSSNENVELSPPAPSSPANGNGNGNGNAAAAAPSHVASNLKQDLAKGLKSFFNRDKRSTTEKNTEANQQISNPQEKTNAAAIAAEVETKRRVKEEEELKRKEEERLMHEEAHAAVDHYSDLVRQVSSTHKYHTPLYLDRDELKRAAARAEAETETDEDMSQQLKMRRAPSPSDDMLLAPPPVSRERRLSISEREQLVHVRDVASNLAMHTQHRPQPQPAGAETPNTEQPTAMEVEESEYPTVLVVPPPKSKSKISAGETESVLSEMVEARPDARGRTRLVKVKRVIKRRVPSSTRSRDTSLSSRPLPASPSLAVERTSQSVMILSAADRDLLEKAAALAMLQSEEQAHEKVRSALSYSTDLVLFLVACYVYLFKDARLVLPILALMIYRQLGEALKEHMPSWLRRKGNDS